MQGLQAAGISYLVRVRVCVRFVFCLWLRSSWELELQGFQQPSYLHDKDAHPHRAKHMLIVIKPRLHLFIAALGSRTKG